MRCAVKTLLLSAVAALPLVFAGPSSSQATNVTPVRHWSYYGGYYGHHHVPYRSYYGGWYGGPRYYHYGPAVRFYRYPHRFYGGHYYHPHGEVYVGPFGFQWWH